MHMIKTLVLGITLLGCLALSSNLHAQSGSDVEQQIKQLQQEAIDAQMKNDVSWAQQHLADGFFAGHSWGVWQTKADFIKDLQNKSNKWKSGNISDLHVATFGSSTAIAHYKFTYDADINGTHRARSVICSDTWVNDSGTWKSAGTHCSLVQGK
jgi:Tfp pilus assembly protein PilV